MTIAFDAQGTAQRYREVGLEELVRIVHVQPDNFLPEAVALAREELRRRGVDGADHPEALAAARQARARLAAKDDPDLPAHPAILVACFVLADLVALVAALVYWSNGRKKASLQVCKAFAFGWLFRIILIGLLILPWGSPSG